MDRLLRRVRYIELRAKYIQMLVKKRRLLLEHIPGLQNLSDGWTKSFKTRDMLINLERGGVSAGTRHQQLVLAANLFKQIAIRRRGEPDVWPIGKQRAERILNFRDFA